MSRLTQWWNQPDQYELKTIFLRQRGLLRAAQRIMAVVAASSAMVPLTSLAAMRHPSTGSVVVGVVGGAFTVALTFFWLMRWPTRRQSEGAALLGVVAIGAWSLVQPTAAVAALTCTAAAITGGYIAFFHSSRPLLINGAIAVAGTTVAVLRLAHEADIQSAITAFWLIWFLNLSVPMAVGAMSQAIGTYAQRSEQDPLTGLLNRRAFTDAVTDRVGSAPAAHTHLAVVMVDLDNFKRINDTHGHSIGDCTLRAVAELLREHTPADAAICRAGGEEFLVALTAEDSDLRPLADRFCAAVAQLDPAITASIGTASAQLHQLSRSNGVNPVDELIARADSAMYAAKRSGGNQAHHIAVM
ncbi:hypothetical protein MKUB_12070 [Mycobacterium kubicae]|uniref:GGDEF domain-containing protein n=1 Tax=Mycobacterium kubicae TaxID=120959 RepID=A0AAX1JAI6_9MYCO|nr:GGDEF domain-containing protein [Mycobacterium kubicae]MCV7097885.1 GGDEF domain-containing protein [Mycobacterium kubicae]ORW06013.1 hypothetical protein AWC13_23930 [Mycobacterium kubicae]QNI10272.1 GGDEF domain-containing protein [Mycobacterium kubicae]QPI38481.1 GGDEF domain-containing protein [Mycobacterium kubicae]GFG63717.1 hypothetical protein MKUB_12070 [Mycobacterium kubicae]